MAEKKWVDIKQMANAREAEIYIYGVISPYPCEEMGEASSMTVANKIMGLDVDKITVHINSLGGSVAEGWAMYNALKNHTAKVETYADGFVCSAALYPFLAGDARKASDVSAFYLHQASTCASGYAEDLRAAADEVEKLTEIGINAFTGVGMDADTVGELMADETWLDAEQALSYGIATEVIKSAPGGAEQSAMRDLVQKLTKKPEEPAKRERENPLVEMFLK